MPDTTLSYADPETASDLVEALYGALLARKADECGLVDKVKRLTQDGTSLTDIVRGFVQSDEFLARLPSLLAGKAGRRLTNDVSQYGEIWMLMRSWVNAQAVCGVVVDVGARGRERSNSYDLMRHFGWKGLLVEANPELLDAIKRDFADLDLTLVSCAVSDYIGRAQFTIGVNDDVSSLSADLARNWGLTNGQISVEVRRLSQILDEHGIPEVFDLLSLDIEGEDIKVLNDLIDHSPYRPNWVIIEASDDFKVATLDDAPFSRKVRRNYAVNMQTSANLILSRRYEEQDAWRKRCGAKAVDKQR